MSVSKLESLPNEILIEIFEKYIHGIDLVKAFRFQLNRRFDTLIQQCQRFRFDFVRCHQSDFRLSMGILRAYLDNIEELALSEQNAPGQLHAFFSFFPSFNLFKRLRKLYLCVDAEAIEPTLLRKALHLLMDTKLHTISIKIIKTDALTSFDRIVTSLFRITTLRKLAIISSTGETRIDWNSLKNFSSNIEYLAIKGIFCDFEDIESIFQCASGLKSINIDLSVTRSYRPLKEKKSSQIPLVQMSKLHTMIAKINGDTRSIQDPMEKLFKSMPSLRRLELNIAETAVNMNIWEILLKSSLPKLTHFTLECIQYRLHDADISTILGTIDIPFWTGKKNYNIVLKEYADIQPRQYYVDSFNSLTSQDSKTLHNEWCILPRREQNGVLCPTNLISKLYVSSHSNSLTRNDYLNNVTDLVIREMNENLLELLTTHVNLSHIKHLDISSLEMQKTTANVFSLLLHMKSLTSLRINADQLTNPQLPQLNDHKKLIFIDASVGQYLFKEKIILSLAKAFPFVEHLVIKAPDPGNVPLLQVHMPKLRSLTFTTHELENQSFDDDYEQKMFDVFLRKRAKFLFQREDQWLTVWLDETAFKDAFWNTFSPRSNGSTSDRQIQNNDDDDDEDAPPSSSTSRRNRRHLCKNS